jgi:NTE family protein
MTGPESDRVRRGLVLGAGGVLGFTWMIGALTALQEEHGIDAREVDVCIGTSAGSILAALIGSGVGADVALRHQQAIPAPGDPDISWDYNRDSGGALPPRPALGPGSPQLLATALRHPRRVPPLAAMSALLPRGRGTLRPLHRMVERVSATLPADTDGRVWPDSPRTWIVAMDYGAGTRVPFGRPGSPPVGLADAVAASCAIPGWYEPLTLDGRRYVDGGTVSTASLDLLAGAGLDEVYVLAPMISFAYDRPRSPAARAERTWRRLVTRRVMAEASMVRDQGTEVTLLGPGPEDLAAIGANLMDPRRREGVLATALRTSAEAFRGAGRSTGSARRVTPGGPRPQPTGLRDR